MAKTLQILLMPIFGKDWTNFKDKKNF